MLMTAPSQLPDRAGALSHRRECLPFLPAHSSSSGRYVAGRVEHGRLFRPGRALPRLGFRIGYAFGPGVLITAAGGFALGWSSSSGR